MTDTNIEERVKVAAQTDQQAKTAFRLWLQIKGGGWAQARNATGRTTWYRNLKILRQAGLSDADFSAGKVVAIRRRSIEMKDVQNWEELRRIAA